MRNLFFTLRSTSSQPTKPQQQQHRENRIIISEPATSTHPTLPPVARYTPRSVAPLSVFSVSAMFGVRQSTCKRCG